MNSPCTKIKAIGTKAGTKALMKILQGKTNQGKEFGYVLEASKGAINSFPVEGDPGTGGIDFEVQGQVDGYIHSHYSGLLSVFSPYDMFAIARFYKNGNIKDMQTFIMGVVTASGTQYMMLIDDPIKFGEFAANLFEGNTFDKLALDLYELTYEKLYKISPNNSVSVNERNFLLYLQANNTGLAFLKGDAEMQNWQLLNKDGEPTNCN